MQPGTLLRWSGGQSNRAAAIEVSTNLANNVWETVKYDLATNGLRQVSLPSATNDLALYRIKIINQIDDPSLVLHYTFENDMGVVNGATNWAMIDSSGHNLHGLSYPLAGTNVHRWPTATNGLDGKTAATFQMYYDGYGKYGRSGDWVLVPITPRWARLTNATIMAWARYYRENYFPDSPRSELVQNCTIFNAYYQGGSLDARWSWNLGRATSPNTLFTINMGPPPNDAFPAIGFPDSASANGGDTLRWNHYVITFAEGLVKGFYNGTNLNQSAFIGTNVLVASKWYAAIGTWNFGRAPASGPYTNGYPNAGWMHGAIDDVRIYDRVLSSNEIAGIYHSFDKAAPTAPTNFHTTAISPAQVDFAWNKATDFFGIAGYRVRRDGGLIADVTATNAVDATVLSGAAYTYTVEAYDTAGNVSEPSTALIVPVP